MKKIYTFLVTFGVLISGVASASLWNYWQDRGEQFIPCNEERYDLALSLGIEEYDCSEEKNNELELALLGGGEQLGGTRPTSPVAGMTYTISGSGITSSATSITLQSLTLPQTGYELTDEDFSDIFYITLEPGSTKRQEIVSCTTVVQGTGTTATLSGCIRGLLPIYPYTTSSTLQFSHAGGTQVIFSDPPQLFEQYISKNSTSTISGVLTFNVYPVMGSTVGNATTSLQIITKGQFDAGLNQGAATSTETVAGISEQATQLEMASSTQFDVQNPHFMSSEYATTTPYTHTNLGNFAVITKNDGYIDQEMLNQAYTFAWTAPHSFSSSTTFTATSTMATTTIRELYNTTTTISTQLTLNGKNVNTLITSSSTDAQTLHYHAGNVATGSASQPINTTGNQVITHYLGVIPSYIQIQAYANGVVSDKTIINSFGTATSTASQSSTSNSLEAGAGTIGAVFQNPNNIIHLEDADGTDEAIGNLSALTANSFTINWTTNANEGSARNYQWTVFK